MDEPQSDNDPLAAMLGNLTEKEKQQHADSIYPSNFMNHIGGGGMNMNNMTSLTSLGYNNMENEMMNKNQSSFR